MALGSGNFTDLDGSGHSSSDDSDTLFIDETVYDDEDERSTNLDAVAMDDGESICDGDNASLPLGSHSIILDSRLDQTFNTTTGGIPTLANLASPSETQLTKTQSNTSGGHLSELHNPLDLSVADRVILNGDCMESGQKTAPVSDNDDSVETFYTAQDTENLNTENNTVNPSLDETSLIRMKFTFNLQVTCQIAYSKDSGAVVEKKVKKVAVINRLTDSLSDKPSTLSSSGSVYSDKSGLPFPLSIIPVASAQTSSTSTNEDVPTEAQTKFKIPIAHPWKNDSLLTVACDEALQKNISLCPAKITPVNRISLASNSLLNKVANASFDLNPIPLESKSTPKRPRGRPKGSKTRTISQEGTSPQMVKSTPKRKYRKKNSTISTNKSSLEATQSETSLLDESPTLLESRKRGRKADNNTSVSPRKKRAVKNKPETILSEMPLAEGELSLFLESPSPRQKPGNGIGVAGPSGLKKRTATTRSLNNKTVVKRFKTNEWNTVPGLDVDETVINTSKVRDEETGDNLYGKLGPIPNKPIFKGMKFLLCYVRPNNATASKKINLHKSSSNSEVSESEDQRLYDCYEKIPFNETRLRKQITAGGGVVFTNFDELPDQDVTAVYLVTNRPNCSAKFLLSFLSKITILQHVHIIEACRNELMRKMRLTHIGWSKVCNKWMEPPRNVHLTLHGKSVHLLNQSLDQKIEESYQKFWTLVLQKIGANIVTDLNFEGADIIITNQPLPTEMEKNIKAVGTVAPTIATIEWLKESILQGYPVSQTLHHSFRVSDDSDSSF